MDGTTPAPGLLEDIFARQLAFQQDKIGIDPASCEGEERNAFMTNMFEALSDEMREARAETHWKHWAKLVDKHGDPIPLGTILDRDAYVSELVDAMHFLVNLFLLADASAEEVHEKYVRKSKVNHKRQDDGYDGSAKCTMCGRAEDEPHRTGGES